MGKRVEEMNFPELIKRFESDIVYDVHSLRAKFERSYAQKMLFSKGREALGPIIKHLQAEKPATDIEAIQEEVFIAWGQLLNRIEIKVDPDKGGPQDLRDTAGWIAWAERFAN